MAEYNSLPETLEAAWFGTIRKIPDLIKWLANCTYDRIAFRKQCVAGCDFRLTDANHDEYFQKLQIMYAKAMIRMKDHDAEAMQARVR